MSITPIDVDDLRNTITEAALLISAAIIFTGTHLDSAECIETARDMLEQIREMPR